MSKLPRSPREAQQFRKPRAQHLTDYDIRKIEDEKTLDALLGIDEPSPSPSQKTDIPSAHEAVEEALASAEDDAMLPNILASDAPESSDTVADTPAGEDGGVSLPDLEDTPTDVASDENTADEMLLPDLDDALEDDVVLGEPEVFEDADMFADDVDSVVAENTPDPDVMMTLDDFLDDQELNVATTPLADEIETTDDGAKLPTVEEFEFDTSDDSAKVPSSALSDTPTPDVEDTADEEIDDAFIEALWDSIDLDDDEDTATAPYDESIETDDLIEEDERTLDLDALLEGMDLSDDDDDNDFDDTDDDDDENAMSLSDFLDATYWDASSDEHSSNEDVIDDTEEEQPTYSAGWGSLAAMMEEDDDTPSAVEESVPEDFTDEHEQIEDDALPSLPDDVAEEQFASEEDWEPEEDVEEEFKEALPTLTKSSLAEDDDDDTPDDDEDESEEDDEEAPLRFVMPPILGPLKSLIGLLGSLYGFIVGIFFKVLIFVLDILAMIPIVGRFVAPLKSMTKLLERIAMALPIVFLLGVVLLFWWFSVPSSHTVELPDMGEATIASIDYDNETGDVTAEVENTGEVIADVDANITIKSLQPTWNPKSWLVFEDAATCSVPVEVAIGETETIEASCDSNIEGFWPRATAELVGREQ